MYTRSGPQFQNRLRLGAKTLDQPFDIVRLRFIILVLIKKVVITAHIRRIPPVCSIPLISFCLDMQVFPILDCLKSFLSLCALCYADDSWLSLQPLQIMFLFPHAIFNIIRTESVIHHSLHDLNFWQINYDTKTSRCITSEPISIEEVLMAVFNIFSISILFLTENI